MSNQTDEEIALAVQQGDAEAFGLLIERYEPKMARYARRFLLSGEDVKDIVQEVFIKSYVNIQSFDATRKFSSWLYRIAHNEYINAVRKKKHEPLFYFDLDIVFPHHTSNYSADADLHREETKKILETCLDKLDDKYREVLVLYYFEELDYKEIADVMRIPVATVGVRLKRGKQALNKLVSQYERE